MLRIERFFQWMFESPLSFFLAFLVIVSIFLMCFLMFVGWANMFYYKSFKDDKGRHLYGEITFGYPPWVDIIAVILGVISTIILGFMIFAAFTPTS